MSNLHALPANNVTYITGKTFFPALISNPFISGLKIAFTLSLILFVIATIASWLQGGRYVNVDDDIEIIKAETEAMEEVFV
ncbi:MAG TPA: hypothetical protein VE439_10170 [Anaerolineae bacterium]|nr:hypothetical protein [Anaerolineae bacterium]